MHQRLTKLEESVAHLERHVDALDEVIRDMHARLDDMRADLERLRGETRERIEWLADRSDADPADADGA